MSTLSLALLALGALAVIGLLYSSFAGPSAAKMQAKRLEKVRERHSSSTEIAAQVQLKRILASRGNTRIDGFAQQFIPNPALLRKRIEMTGRTWTLGQYMM